MHRIQISNFSRHFYAVNAILISVLHFWTNFDEKKILFIFYDYFCKVMTISICSDIKKNIRYRLIPIQKKYKSERNQRYDYIHPVLNYKTIVFLLKRRKKFHTFKILRKKLRKLSRTFRNSTHIFGILAVLMAAVGIHFSFLRLCLIIFNMS